MKTNFEENIFNVSEPSDIPVSEFDRIMARDTFACIRGVISQQEVLRANNALREQFSRNNDHPSVGQAPNAVRYNSQFLKVGGESSSRANDDARLFRASYNPIWEEDIYDFRNGFIKMAQVRNVICRHPINFAIEKIEPDGLWTAARFHQYPTGGGFFQGHTDYIVKDIGVQANTQFYQLVLIMSSKTEGDFESGGGYVDVDGQRIVLEDHFLPGDILVYDGRSAHGVEDIDPHRSLDLDTYCGRVSALVTLYKAMD